MVRRQQGYADEAGPMKGFIIIEADSGVDSCFPYLLKVCFIEFYFV